MSTASESQLRDDVDTEHHENITSSWIAIRTWLILLLKRPLETVGSCRRSKNSAAEEPACRPRKFEYSTRGENPVRMLCNSTVRGSSNHNLADLRGRKMRRRRCFRRVQRQNRIEKVLTWMERKKISPPALLQRLREVTPYFPDTTKAGSASYQSARPS